MMQQKLGLNLAQQPSLVNEPVEVSVTHTISDTESTRVSHLVEGSQMSGSLPTASAIRTFRNLPSGSRFEAARARLSRRHFSGRMLSWLAVLTHPPQQWAQGEVSSFDFSLLDAWITPNALFFIRHHSGSITAPSEGWAISVSGAVAAPYELPYEELIRQPHRSLAVTIECAENPVGGGLVSNAEWTGTSMAVLLQRAKPLPSAQFVRLYGADDYVKTIPLSKAAHPETLIAYRMNDDALSTAHGNPVRAVIPGWFGMASVKWLRKIELVTNNQDQTYTRQNRTGSTKPITSMSVKSAFARPLDGAILFGRRFLVRGAAWAGEEKVRKVEISTDGGSSWQAASLRDTPQSYAWVRWELEWKIAASGDYELLVRAGDSEGRLQPAERDSARLDEYEQNTNQKVHVKVV